MKHDQELLNLDPTIKNITATTKKASAGDVVYDIKPSPFWNALDENFGKGGSAEFPLRTTVERRIKNSKEIRPLKNPEVRIEPTNLCNYTCVMCPRDTHDRDKGYMPIEFFRSVVDEVILMGATQITLVNFGEPFIDPTLEDKIKYITDKGLRSYLITNVSLLHLPSKSEFAKSFSHKMTKAEAAIRAGLTEMRLSFYGADKKSYEEIMVGGKFEQVESNLKLLQELRAKFGNEIISPTTKKVIKNPEISAFYLEFKHKNSEDMKKFMTYTKDLADYVEVWQPHNFGNGRDYRELKVEKKSCGRPNSGPIQINWKGIVVPCCFDYNEEIPLGNVAQMTVEEVLYGTAYDKLRESHNTKNFGMVPYCDKCDQLCERNDALIISTNPKHQNRSPEDIMKSPNTLADFKME